MSGDSSGEKTEQPTDKKIRDARKQGQVSRSTDISSTALLIIICEIESALKSKHEIIEDLK
jgi:type III secretory pathway component EscU